MKDTENRFYRLSWQQVINGYSLGIFPMGDEDGSISWYETSPRAVMPIELASSSIKISRSLAQVLKKKIFEIRIDTAFGRVIRECASARETSWINKLIVDSFSDLHERGFAHSVEAWQNGKLVGGLYGVAFRGAFFGESMFYKVSNASKVCVVKLYEILKNNNYVLFDIQMMTPHFKQLGAVDIPRKAYLEILERAMDTERVFEY